MSIFSFIQRHAVAAGTVAFVAVAGGLIAGRVAERGSAADTAVPRASRVALVDVSSFRNGTSTISATGSIEAHDQADLKAQVSAPVALVSAEVGDTVYAGQTILELSNADIRAQLASARASLVMAQGSYGSTRQSAIDKIRSAYIAGDSAVHGTVDPLIFNAAASNNPGNASQLFSYVTDSTLANRIRNERSDLTQGFTAWKYQLDALSATSTDDMIHMAVVGSQKAMNAITSLLDDVSTAINSAAIIAPAANLATLNGWQASVAGARNSILAANSGLTTAESTLAGGSSATAAQAGVAIADASVHNLEAQLAKTIVTSPVNGRISDLPLRAGEFASPGTLLATVIGNSGGLEAKVYVSGDDLARVRAGASATVNGSIRGIVSSVAPSVSATSRSAEVDIDIVYPNMSGLVAGQNVSVAIDAVPLAAGSAASAYILPIQDIKVMPSGPSYVYTIDADSKVRAVPVTIGAVTGDFVEVSSGLSEGMKIISPVYELEEGQTVDAR